VQAPPAIAGTFFAGRALFGAGSAGLAGDMVLALDPSDASGSSTTDGCSALTNADSVAGLIALIDRGPQLLGQGEARVDAGAPGRSPTTRAPANMSGSPSS
jgi:hypothetical protein